MTSLIFSFVIVCSPYHSSNSSLHPLLSALSPLTAAVHVRQPHMCEHWTDVELTWLLTEKSGIEQFQRSPGSQLATNMYFFAKILSLFKMSSLVPAPDPIPAALMPDQLARRPLSVWYSEFVNLSREDYANLAAFHLLSIFHWEYLGRLKHKGLTFVFERDPASVVYLRVDRMSIENDPWTSDDFQTSLKALAPYSMPSQDQNTIDSLAKAVDWCRPLDDRGILKYFTGPNSDPPSPTSSARSLGTTRFQNPDTRPNVINVILAIHAVSKLRPNYNVWEANCWWLARSIRRFIQTEWRGEPDGPIPPGLFVDRYQTTLPGSRRNSQNLQRV
jgi:hypothetical protein